MRRRHSKLPTTRLVLSRIMHRLQSPASRFFKTLPCGKLNPLPATDGERPTATKRGKRRRPLIALRLTNRSEEPTSELQSLMRISYAVFCLHNQIDVAHIAVRILVYS